MGWGERDDASYSCLLPGCHTRDTSGNECLLMEAGDPSMPGTWDLGERSWADLTLPCPHWPAAEGLRPGRHGSARIPRCRLQQWQTGLSLGSEGKSPGESKKDINVRAESL